MIGTAALVFAVCVLLDALRQRLFRLLHSTCCDKFRSADNVNRWVCLWWQIASGNFAPFMTDNLVESANERNIDVLCKCIENQEYAMICINDPDGDVDVEALAQKLRQAFHKNLPG